jgi:DNA invertase Pin-like site-specific DNA recombinase
MFTRNRGARVRAFLYARVSTIDKGQDTENQLPEMRRDGERRGWTIKREYIDNVSAGGTKVREQFDEMLAACDRGEADVILIWALDRFSREGPLKTMLLLDRLERAGVRVRSLKEPWLDPDSPTYELLLPIFAWIAKQERLRMGERVRAGMARAREQGARFGRPRVSLTEQDIAQRRAQGFSLRAIARELGVSEGSVRNALKMAASVRKNGSENPVQK